MAVPIFTRFVHTSAAFGAPTAVPTLATDGFSIAGATHISVWTVLTDAGAGPVTAHSWRLWIMDIAGNWGVYRGSASGALAGVAEYATFQVNQHADRAVAQLQTYAGAAGSTVTFEIIGISRERD